MANVVKQFRYYSDDESSTKNYPTGVTGSQFISGSVFDGYNPILQLGVQSLPGTMFYLNDAIDPIIIGRTGIYELDLNEQTQISNMRFDYNSIQAIANNVNSYLIVDIIYNKEEV